MTKLDKLRSRYLQDPVPVRLGGLAANLSRIASFSKNDSHFDVISAILQESKWFIEWTAVDLDINDAAELVKLQIDIAVWQLQSHKKWNDKHWRSEFISQSEKWSQRILQMSGLLSS